ncbi:MAG: lipopolysaccharide heptosyltransferase II [Candidatus Omnitrophota bacterium]|jgi:heptosyltransferase-2|nr:MAG: lipopolysaccharide heptosyltransferase II [Candidatus Omnitrophota bacterium]
MKSPDTQIRKILFVTLSNIGDVILTLPALDYLKSRFPMAAITVICGPRAKGLFAHGYLNEHLLVYDKHCPFLQKLQFLSKLRKEKFDAVIDLRNSIFGVFLLAPYRILPFLRIPKSSVHMKDRHLYRVVRAFDRPISLPQAPAQRSIFLSDNDRDYIKTLLTQHGIGENDRIVVISAGARSHTKRWGKEKYLALIHSFIDQAGIKIILVGEKDDAGVSSFISAQLKGRILDLTGLTTITQLACLLQKAALVITNDSANLHLASYLDRPVIAFFGPTDEMKYGPWSSHSLVIKKDIYCRPCQKAQCKFGHLHCLSLIKAHDAEAAVRSFLAQAALISRTPYPSPDFKRILIVRTDRIGDVLLSTPVIKALRQAYPCAYIAMTVAPYAADIVEGNPYLDEIIIFAKESRDKGLIGNFRFVRRLRRQKFDVCFVLHPTTRLHLLMYLARVPRRVGYNRKLGFLLTDRIVHKKQTGEKHESEYSLDVIRYLGIEADDNNPFMPIRQESEAWAETQLQNAGIRSDDKILAIHPGASCRSKLWPEENFASVCDQLTERVGFKVVVVAGPKDTEIAERILARMRHRAVNFAGKTSVSQLASLLKRCSLFISNDSGPVHIASALGIPVVAIFGRSQNGLSPVRWGPLGEKSAVLRKNVGCVECLAHNCKKEFACIRAITPDDVIKAVADFNYYL